MIGRFFEGYCALSAMTIVGVIVLGRARAIRRGIALSNQPLTQEI